MKRRHGKRNSRPCTDISQSHTYFFLRIFRSSQSLALLGWLSASSFNLLIFERCRRIEPRYISLVPSSAFACASHVRFFVLKKMKFAMPSRALCGVGSSDVMIHIVCCLFGTAASRAFGTLAVTQGHSIANCQCGMNEIAFLHSGTAQQQNSWTA